MKMLHKYPTAKECDAKEKNVEKCARKAFATVQQNQTIQKQVQTLPVLRGRILYREREREREG